MPENLMKPALQLNISQHLTLTPQLQQAIRLLQLSTLDLQQEIQQITESNPMLEVTPREKKEELPVQTEQDTHSDFQWSQLYNHRKYSSTDEDNYDNLYCATINLAEHLHWQVNLSAMSDTDKLIAAALIDATNEDGFLTSSPDELMMTLSQDLPSIEMEEIETVKHQLHYLDPIGCVATNLRETLLVQLNQIEGDKADITLAKLIIGENITLLGQHNYRQILKQYRVSDVQLQNVLSLIKRLNPKPGSLITQTITEYLIPDVIVKKIGNRFEVHLNNDCLPKLSINHHYASLVKRANSSADNQFLKNNLQEARWFLKSIESRQETLLRVANCIVEYQRDFFEFGEVAMKPLILNDIAQRLDMHESTVSRVTTQKYMHTPRGMFELKYFFSSHVNTLNGGECSSTAIRAFIKQFIANEQVKKPLSDSEIARLIGNIGVKVARRTVAKYREAMNIPPSNERKTF